MEWLTGCYHWLIDLPSEGAAVILFILANIGLSLLVMGVPIILLWNYRRRLNAPEVQRFLMVVIAFLFLVAARLFVVSLIPTHPITGLIVVLTVSAFLVGLRMLFKWMPAKKILETYRPPEEMRQLLIERDRALEKARVAMALRDQQVTVLREEGEKLREQLIDLQSKGMFFEELQKMRETLHRIRNT